MQSGRLGLHSSDGVTGQAVLSEMAHSHGWLLPGASVPLHAASLGGCLSVPTAWWLALPEMPKQKPQHLL